MHPSALLHYRLPLDTPIRFAGQTLDQREGLLLKFSLDGQLYYGDCCPLPGFSRDTLAQNQDSLLAYCQREGDEASLPPAARFALDSGRLLCQPQRRPPPSTVPLLAGSEKQVLAQLSAQLQPPRLAKLKVARAPVEEEINLVHRVLGQAPGLRLRLDANRGWTYEQAATFAASVPLDRIDFVEEPCATLEESLALYQQHRLPLALDETTQAQEYRYQPLPGVTALVLKPTLIGGIDRLTDIVEAAHHDGVRCVLSSSFESNLGLAAIAALARQLTPEQTPGLDTLEATGADLCQPNLWGVPGRPLIPEAQLERLF
ncbi:o-succinylbenzoate synthase [Ferrimonas gelatinilytica]|uniref:o-succinylbenzoate synthase n=1 Tax=Ferrimonas gelatinilytica TaxID=1255257 RepID=A0ABP9SAR7_9GAMM